MFILKKNSHRTSILHIKKKITKKYFLEHTGIETIFHRSIAVKNSF